MTSLDHRVGVLRLIEWERQSACHFAAHGQSRAGRDGRRIQKVTMYGDEAALRLSSVDAWVSGTIEREL
jgi:lipase chaperone LimK